MTHRNFRHDLAPPAATTRARGAQLRTLWFVRAACLALGGMALVRAPSARSQVAVPKQLPALVVPVKTTLPSLQIGSPVGTCHEAHASPGGSGTFALDDSLGLLVPVTNASTTAVSGDLRVELGELGAASLQTQSRRVALAAQRLRDMHFEFDFAGVPAQAPLRLYFNGVLLFEGFAEFDCVRKCPAHNVMVRRRHNPDEELLHPELCLDLEVSGGKWLARVAAASFRETYCSYAWEPLDSSASNGAAHDLAVFGQFEPQDVEVDCAVVGSLAEDAVVGADDLVAAVSVEEMEAASAARLGIAARDELVSQGTWPQALSRVRLAVVDTAAHSFAEQKLQDTSPHGRNVGLIAQRTACGADANCPVFVDNHLALPIVEIAREPAGWSYLADTVNGGRLGARGQVAAALYDLARDLGDVPTVVTLSLGWHSKHDCAVPGCNEPLSHDRASEVAVPNGVHPNIDSSQGDTEAHSLATRAVMLSIAELRCAGAAVLAAAGNSVADDDEGPLTPAAWQRLDAARLRCGDLFDDVAGQGAPSGGLVSAIGAVTSVGSAIGLTREGSLPPLMGLGAGMAVLDPRLDPQPLECGQAEGCRTPVRLAGTGTSYGTAVAAGAAASLWSLVGPDASAEEILIALHEAGLSVLQPEGSARTAELCTNGAPACPLSVEVTACTPLHALANRLTDSEGDTEAWNEEDVYAAAANCQVARTRIQANHPMDAPESVLPEDGAYAVKLIDRFEAPWAVPQPTDPKCKTCLMSAEVADFYTDLLFEFDAETDDSFLSVYVLVNEENVPLAELARPLNAELFDAVLGDYAYPGVFFWDQKPASLLVHYPYDLATQVTPVGETELTHIDSWGHP